MEENPWLPFLFLAIQNPDNDAIMSAVVLSQLLNQVEYAGNTYEACALGALPAESAKLLADAGVAEPRQIDSVEEGQLVLLTDHNESAQSVEGLKSATVFGVVDHHRIGDFETAGPLHYLAFPWGSSCTIVTKVAQMLGIELTDVQAKLLLSAMMTDTLMLKSPTTTDVDRTVAAQLGEQVGVDPVKLWHGGLPYPSVRFLHCCRDGGQRHQDVRACWQEAPHRSV